MTQQKQAVYTRAEQLRRKTFLDACKRFGVKPTKRQASDYRRRLGRFAGVAR